MLEERTLLSTITVTTSLEHEDGKLSLREAIDQANAASDFDEIVFSSSLAGQPIDLTLGQLTITQTVSITGLGAQKTVIDAQDASRVFDITITAGDVTLSDLTVTGGKTNAAGQSGGGVRSLSTGTLKIEKASIAGNTTLGTSSDGGGLSAVGGNLTLISSTVSGNTTSGNFSQGGGISIRRGDLALINSTVSGNSVGAVSYGGGIYAHDANVTLTSSTLSDNSSAQPGPGIHISASLPEATVTEVTPNADSLFLLRLENSIVSGNHTQAGFGKEIFLHVYDGYDTDVLNISASHSLVGVNVGAMLPPGAPDANGNLVGSLQNPINALLGPLADNGGPTQTMALLTGSPAINAGGTTSLQFDQRGTPFQRVFDGQLDMGAFELQPAASPLIDTTPVSTIEVTEGGGFCAVIMTFTDTELDSLQPDFTVTVDWGAAVIDPSFTVELISTSTSEAFWKVIGMGTFPVGSAAGSPYVPTVHVEDSDGNTVSTTNTTFEVVEPVEPLRLLHRQTGLAGFYFVLNPVRPDEVAPQIGPNDDIAEVLQNGARLTLVDENGESVDATIENDTDITIPEDEATAVFDHDEGTITFSDGTVWVKIRQIAGQWLTTEAPPPDEVLAALPPGTGVGGIRQLGPIVHFTDANGDESIGSFLTATTLRAEDWDLEGTLTEEGRRIEWDDGTVWDLIPDFAGDWMNAAGRPNRIEQQGEQLLFINRFGETSLGEYVGVDQVDSGESWGHRIGTIVGQSIVWDNQTTWSIPAVIGHFPELGGLWEGALGGSSVRVLQANQALTFVNRFGESTPGHFDGATHVVAEDWHQRGELVGHQIRWENQTIWTIYPDLGGPYLDETDVESGVNQLERSLTFTDRDGVVTHGTLLDPTHIQETDGAQRTALIDGNEIVWSDEKTWTKLPLLWGNWQDTSFCGPTYIEQMGSFLLFLDPFGNPLVGSFVTPSAAEVQFEGGGPTIHVTIADENTLIFEVPQGLVEAEEGGDVWKRFPPNLLDNVFANPNFWPYL